MKNHRINLILDIALIGLSVIVAVFLARSGVIDAFLKLTEDFRLARAFMAGFFFVSFFTAAPSLVVLAELAAVESPFFVAFFGGLGALLGDYLVFRFVRDAFSKDLIRFMSVIKERGWLSVVHFHPLRWPIRAIAVIMIASPLPDELGLIVLGLSKTHTPLFIFITYTLHFVGILALALVARAAL